MTKHGVGDPDRRTGEDRSGSPGHRAQAALHVESLARVMADRDRLNRLIATPLGRETLDRLQHINRWSQNTCLVWLNAPNAWLEGDTPADHIERFPQGGRDLERALRAALVRRL